MEDNFLPLVQAALKKVKKGDIRNTVLRQIHVLKESLEQLSEGLVIKQREIQEYEGEEKEKKLQHQVDIIKAGTEHLKQAITVLSQYKKTSSH